MRKFMKTILSGIQAWTRGEIRNSTADWNQNDSNADNYIKNRTHYDSRYIETVTYTFDGNMEGKETIYVQDTEYLVKITDDVLEVNEIIGATASMYVDGNVETSNITEDIITVISDVLYVVGEGNMLVAAEDTELEGKSFTKGMWVMCILLEESPVIYPNKLICNFSRGELKKLDSKYLNLPKNIATMDDVDKALDAADYAQYTANNAQNIANTKMNATNPSGTGTFNMNDSVASGTGAYAIGSATRATGNYSCTRGIGTSTIINYSDISGKYNIAEKRYQYISTPSITYSSHTANGSSLCYYATDYVEDLSEGTLTLIDPIQDTWENFIDRAVGNTKTFYICDNHKISDDSLIRTIPYGQTGETYKVSNFSQVGIERYKRIVISETSTAGDGKYAHVVGNGTSTSNRSNAHTLDWSGNAWYSGDVYVGSTSGTNKDEGSKKLATEESVHNLLIETGLITPEDIDAICGVTSEVTT